MAISAFTLTKPIRLFEATWNAADMSALSSDDDYLQTGDTDIMSLVWGPGGITLEWTPTDTYGIPWSPVPDAAWNQQLAGGNTYKAIGAFEVAYLRLSIAVIDGVPGDSVLFLLNQPNTTTGSGLHAHVSVDVGPDPAVMAVNSVGIPIVNTRHRSVGAEQHLIRGYPGLDQYPTGAQALARMQSITEVRILGLRKSAEAQVVARCDFLGGFM